MDSLKQKITAIKPGKNQKVHRSSIFLNGKYAFSLDDEVIKKELIKIGLELSTSEINLLTKSDQLQRCVNAASRLISFRPRSEGEIKQRLSRKGYVPEEIEKTVSQLKELHLLDDSAFGGFWTENRNSFKPRSRIMLKQELRVKGLDKEVIEEVIKDVDDAENAYQAALKKARTLPVADYQIFRRRLGSFLQRRGFGYGVINNVVKKVWEERTEGLAVSEEAETGDVTD